MCTLPNDQRLLRLKHETDTILPENDKRELEIVCLFHI